MCFWFANLDLNFLPNSARPSHMSCLPSQSASCLLFQLAVFGKLTFLGIHLRNWIFIFFFLLAKLVLAKEVTEEMRQWEEQLGEKNREFGITAVLTPGFKTHGPGWIPNAHRNGTSYARVWETCILGFRGLGSHCRCSADLSVKGTFTFPLALQRWPMIPGPERYLGFWLQLILVFLVMMKNESLMNSWKSQSSCWSEQKNKLNKENHNF